MPTENELRAQLTRLSLELDRRTDIAERLRPYDEGGCHIPDPIVRGRLTNAYSSLMSAAEAPWGSLIVDSVQDRLEVASISDNKNDVAADEVWGLWQDNSMDSESKLAHRSALLDGRAYAMVWPDDTGTPAISLDDSTQMVVQYQDGSRRTRVAACRRWVDEFGVSMATLYRPEAIYKFTRGKVKAGETPSAWAPRDGSIIIPNPTGKVPVVELRVNAKLRPGCFPYARGEYAHCLGLMDRINLLTFFGLVVALWEGFPLRGVIGDEILKDDDGKPIAPFESKPNSVFQLEDPNAKIVEFTPADRSNLSVFDELEQLASISKTPKHYFPLRSGMSNIAADTIRANEGTLHSKVTGHKASLGEGWEETLRLAGAMLPTPVELSTRAELDWKDHESRSLAERADAAVKLSSIEGMPFAAVAELALNATGDQIARWEGSAMGGVLDELMKAQATPEAPVVDVAVPVPA